MATEGGEWPDDYRQRLDPQTPLDSWILKYLDPSAPVISILDVGSGPMTNLGKIWPGHDVRLTAVDALADEYNRLLDELGVAPPVRTQRCDSERLLERFPENHFDLVHARNTLDHSYQPVEAIRQMLGVVKPTGLVVLSHSANEAENMEYQGFHQWNFCVENEDFIIWDKQSHVSVKDRLRGLAEIVEISPSGSDWVQAVLRKC